MSLMRKTSALCISLVLALSVFNHSIFGQETVPENATNQPIAKDEIADNSTKKSAEEVTKENVTLSDVYLRRVGINSRQTRSLTLRQAIRLALNNNNDIEVARDDVKLAELSLRSLLGGYDGTVNITPSFNRNSTNGQNATKDLRVNSDFTKLLKKGGGDYRVFFNNSRTENSFAQSQATQGNISGGGNSALYFTSAGISYTQPLMRNLKVDQTRRQIKIQQKRIAQSDVDFRRRTIEIISQVQTAYWDLVFALRDRQNRVANLNLTKENLRQVEARIAAGSAAPLQKAEVSTELANRETDVLVASQQVSIAENTLKRLLLKDGSAPEWLESFVPTDKPVFTLDRVNLGEAMKDAIQNRPELSRLRLEREVNKIDVDYFKNQTKPRLDLTSTLSFDGLASSGSSSNAFVTPLINSANDQTNADAYLLSLIRRFNNNLPIESNIPQVFVPASPDFLSGGYTQAFRNIFRSDSPNYSFGITFSFPLKNSVAKANLAAAKITEKRIESQKRLQEQSIITEVRNAVQAVETAQQRVLTAKRARENAEIQLEGEIKLYNAGRSTIFLRFQRENALTNARNAEIRAETDYNKAIASLQRATSTTLLSNNVVVDSPMDNKGDGN